MNRFSRRRTMRPIIFPPIAQNAAAQGNNSVPGMAVVDPLRSVKGDFLLFAFSILLFGIVICFPAKRKS
jgi:hypothetical protein